VTAFIVADLGPRFSTPAEEQLYPEENTIVFGDANPLEHKASCRMVRHGGPGAAWYKDSTTGLKPCLGRACRQTTEAADRGAIVLALDTLDCKRRRCDVS